MTDCFKFNIISIGHTTTYAIQIPDTSEGIALLDEIGRALSHRSEYDLAKRIARVVAERKEQLRAASPGAKPHSESKPAISKAKNRPIKIKGDE